MHYRIVSSENIVMGIYRARTPAEALLTMFRHAGHGADEVRLDGDKLIFTDTAVRQVRGQVGSWRIEPV